MSFVVFVGCQYFGIMIGDKRKLSYSGKIESEECEKVIKINSKLAICFGGDCSMCDHIRNVVFSYDNNYLNYSDVKEIIYMECVRLREYLCKKGYTQMKMSVGLMGADTNINFTSYYVTYDRIDTEERLYMTEDESGYCVIANGRNNLEKVFSEKILNNPVYSVNNIVNIFKEILYDFSGIDTSINKEFSYEIISIEEKIERDRIKI